MRKGKQTFGIAEGRDIYNDKPIYRLVGINNEHVGEWYDTKQEARNEINKL